MNFQPLLVFSLVFPLIVYGVKKDKLLPLVVLGADLWINVFVALADKLPLALNLIVSAAAAVMVLILLGLMLRRTRLTESKPGRWIGKTPVIDFGRPGKGRK